MCGFLALPKVLIEKKPAAPTPCGFAPGCSSDWRVVRMTSGVVSSGERLNAAGERRRGLVKIVTWRFT